MTLLYTMAGMDVSLTNHPPNSLLLQKADEKDQIWTDFLKDAAGNPGTTAHTLSVVSFIRCLEGKYNETMTSATTQSVS